MAGGYGPIHFSYRTGSSRSTIVIRDDPPARRVDGIVQAPADVGAGQPGELDVQAVLHPGPAQDLVVGPGGLQLLGRVQVGDVHQAPGRQVPEARHPFVDGMVGDEVLALQVVAALPPIVEPDEERPDVVRRAFTDHEAITGQAAGLVDQGRGGRPAGLVERGGVHGGQDSIEHVVFAS